MYVVKRNGLREPVQFDKITQRLSILCDGLTSVINPTKVAQQVCAGLYNGVTTQELDELAAETAAQMTIDHPDYNVLAGRIAISNLHRSTENSFSEVTRRLYEFGIIRQDYHDFIQQHKVLIDGSIKYDRDMMFDYFGFKTLEKSYLLRINKVIVERPQHLYMRVACEIHRENVPKVLETYDLLSQGYYIHATPTLFNCGLIRPQMASCFLMTAKDDSIDGIYSTLKNCALISKHAGGIGISISNIRSRNAFIKGTNGTSNGIIPMLRVFNATARYVDQGGGKRPGSFAIYLEPHHPDIMDFLNLRKNNGAEELRCRDLFLGLWISDLFMERVRSNQMWSLFSPNDCPDLQDAYGSEYVTKYTNYEADTTVPRQTIRARTIWTALLVSQQETGTPYMLYKHACNAKSNQRNIGTIRSSNLCTEIIQYSDANEIAVCNLASIALPKCVVDGKFDYQRLATITRTVVSNLNQVIDRTYYPLPETKRSNMRHRPMGIGVQGLAVVFMKLHLPYESPDAQVINARIFETIYFAALQQSMELAKTDGPYATFPGSPASKGLLQYDLWGTTNTIETQRHHDWSRLKRDIKQFGLRNSLLVAQMPTASTSQILGNTESTEPISSNVYVRRTSSGEFQIVNKYLIQDLVDLKLWDQNMKHMIMRAHGSIQSIECIPDHIKHIHKTVYEMKTKTLIDMSASRGQFIDQSESFNCFIDDPSMKRLTSIHFYTWKKGMKTGCYYLRTLPASNPQQITIPVSEPCVECSA